MADCIKMSADEFLDRWVEWAPRDIGAREASLLQAMLVNILMEFELRGSLTHRRQVFGPGMSVIFSSPDCRING